LNEFWKHQRKRKMKIFKPGEMVGISPGSDPVKGRIVSVTIYGDDRVVYSCSWWNGRTRTVDHFESHEVSGRDAAVREIGFHAREAI
jgi:hypothetical protein